MSEETKEYVVTRPNTAGLRTKGPKQKVVDLEVGSTVMLTNAQAAARVNKVRLKDEADAEVSKAGRKSKLETEHKELTQRVSDLEARAEEGNKRISELEAQNKALLGENVALKAAAAK